jgi:hypothetical protein
MDTIKNSEWSRNGKGDDERPMDRKKFRANFDEIDWSAHRKNVLCQRQETHRGLTTEPAMQISGI